MKTLSVALKYKHARVQMEEHRVQFPNGNTGIYPIINFPTDSVTVAIVRGGKILLLREYKYAVGARIVTLPSGYMNVDETPYAAALREVKEETGIGGLRLQSLGSVHPFPANSKVANHLFIAFGGKQGEATPEDGEEDLKGEWIAIDEAEEMAFDGRITHAPAVAAVLKAARFLRQQGA